MFRCVCYTDSMQKEWDNLALSKGTVFHTASFRQILLHSFGYKCGYQAIVDEDNKIRGLIPLVIGRNLGFKMAGVSLPFVNYLDICADSGEALDFAFNSLPGLKEKYRLNYLEIRLKEQPPEKPGWKINTDNYTFVLPLSPDEENVLALSTAGNRNHIRKAYKSNLFAASVDTALKGNGNGATGEFNRIEAFYRVYAKRMKELGSPSPGIGFFKAFFKYLPEYSFLLTVLEQKKQNVIGGMLLLTNPANATLYYPYGASLTEYNSKYLNNFMYWEAVKFGLRSKMKFLDLGRSQAASGTYRYKTQWGAAAEELKYLSYIGGAKLSGAPDRKKLSPLTELWKKTPDFITGTAGPMLIKYVMP